MAKTVPSKISKPQSLRVLMVEDSESDEQLIIRALKKGGYEPEYERMETAAEMKKALKEKQWDIILCDYKMPEFNAPSAITLLQETNIDIPLIIVSGAIGEETAVECMHSGAHDYIMKNNLSRLCPAITRELEDAKARAQRKQAEEALRNEQIMLARTEGIAHVGSWEWDIATDTVLWSEELFRIFQRDPKEGAPSFAEHPAFYHPDDIARLTKVVEAAVAYGTPYETELRALRKDGETRICVARGIAEMSPGGRAVRLFGSLQDITERKRAEAELRESEERFHTMFRGHDAIMLLIDQKTGAIRDANLSATRFYGYSTEQLCQMTIQEINALPAEEVAHQRTMAIEEKRNYFIFPHRLASGEVKTVEVHSSPIITNKEAILFSIIHDITDRKQAEAELIDSKELIEAVVENVPLMIFLKKVTDLRFVIFNRAGEELLGYDRKDLLGKNDLDLFPPEQAAHFMAKDREVLDGETVMLDIPEEPIQTAKKGERLLHTRKVCIQGFDGATKFLLGISEDITERKQAEKKLEDTLESLKKAVSTTIQVLVSAVESRDPYTAGHQIRVADIAISIATEMGLPQDKIDGLRMAGSIHDIGKLSIPAEILSKPTKLTEIELSLIKEHSQKGYEMLKDVESSWPLAEMVYQHHERMDGSGYPRKLKGNDILIEARILIVADVVEAIASHRPYRHALGIEAALDEIEENKGTLYDEAVVDTCLRLFREKGYQLT